MMNEQQEAYTFIEEVKPLLYSSEDMSSEILSLG